MDYQSLHMKTVADLRQLAKGMGVKVPAGTKKTVLIDLLLEADKAAQPAPKPVEAPAVKVEEKPAEDTIEEKPAVKAETITEDQSAPKRRGRPPKAKAEPEKQPEPVAEVPKAVEAPAKEEEKPAPATGEKQPEAARTEAPQPVRRFVPQPQANVRRAAGEHQTFTHTRNPMNNNRGTNMGNNNPNRMGQRPANPRFVQRQDNGPRQAQETAPQPQEREIPETGSARGRREGYYNAEYKTSNPAVPEMLTSGECADGAGVLEIQPDGYGFLRAENCLPGPNDVYISIAQIRRFNLRMGDYVVGKTRAQREGDRYSAMLYITSVNGRPPEEAANRPRFEDLVPIYPDQRLRLESPNPVGRGDFSLRLIDMLAPIGKGQRGMIVSQPKAGKTTLLKKVANAITSGYPEVKLIVMLIDERPEEVTDMKRSIDGEVIYSTFDEAPENHVRVSEMVLERAQRLVEMGQDVVVLMDSITRLARAYNLVITPTGRSLSGGLDPGALFKPKRFFGAARNIENGGSLTIIATALVDTGSRMDDIIFEEFKGTGNMELHLDRKLSDRRVFPAIDMLRSGTRREELLLTESELNGEMLVRRVLSGGRSQEMAEQIISLISKTTTNEEFFEKMKGWVAVFEKEGFSLGGKQQ